MENTEKVIEAVKAIIARQNEFIATMADRITSLEKIATEPETVKEMREYFARQKGEQTLEEKEIKDIVNTIMG